MSRKNKDRKQNSESQRAHALPWSRVGDTVLDADGYVVKAPHHCSWEGNNYRDDDGAAQMIVEAVNNYYS